MSEEVDHLNEEVDHLQLLDSILADDVIVFVNPFRKNGYFLIVEKGRFILKITLDEVREKANAAENHQDH